MGWLLEENEAKRGDERLGVGWEVGSWLWSIGNWWGNMIKQNMKISECSNKQCRDSFEIKFSN